VCCSVLALLSSFATNLTEHACSLHLEGTTIVSPHKKKSIVFPLNLKVAEGREKRALEYHKFVEKSLYEQASSLACQTIVEQL
jgi:hypothetical protein